MIYRNKYTVSDYYFKMKLQSDPTYTVMWPGGVVAHGAQFETVRYRLSNGNMKTYNRYDPGFYHRFTYTFEKMPGVFWSLLNNFLLSNRGTSAAPPALLDLSWYKTSGGRASIVTGIDFEEDEIGAMPEWAPQHRCLGWTGSVNFIGAVVSNVFVD